MYKYIHLIYVSNFKIKPAFSSFLDELRIVIEIILDSYVQIIMLFSESNFPAVILPKSEFYKRCHQNSSNIGIPSSTPTHDSRRSAPNQQPNAKSYCAHYCRQQHIARCPNGASDHHFWVKHRTRAPDLHRNAHQEDAVARDPDEKDSFR